MQNWLTQKALKLGEEHNAEHNGAEQYADYSKKHHRKESHRHHHKSRQRIIFLLFQALIQAGSLGKKDG